MCIDQQDVCLSPKFPLVPEKSCQKQDVTHDTQKGQKTVLFPSVFWGEHPPDFFMIRDRKCGLLLSTTDNRQVLCLFLPGSPYKEVSDCNLMLQLFPI